MQTEHSQGLVSSADVNGETVYSPTGESIGHIDHLMIDKKSGNVAYAVMQFGDFMGIGGDHYPVPWKKLNYDTEKQGFATDLTREQVEGAPRATSDNWYGDRREEELLHQHYGVANPYWF